MGSIVRTWQRSMPKPLKRLTFSNLVSSKQISVECTCCSFNTRTHIDTKADVQIRHIDQHKNDTQVKRNREWVPWVGDGNGQVAPLCKVSSHQSEGLGTFLDSGRTEGVEKEGIKGKEEGTNATGNGSSCRRHRKWPRNSLFPSSIHPASPEL